MLKILSFLLVLSFSANSFSQSCVGSLLAQKKESYFDRLPEDKQRAISTVSGFSGLIIGVSVASAALPAFGIAVGIALAPIAVGAGIREIHNKPIKRMIKLITQSHELVNDPSSEPGKLLKRLHKRIQREHGEVSIQELAQGIVTADQNQDCGSIRRVKEIQENIDSGRLPLVQI